MNHKESTTFYSTIKASKADKEASISELRRINAENSVITAEISSSIKIDIDLSNEDLLPIEYEAFNVNYVNKNDDCVGAEDTVKLYKSFVGKPLNRKHTRTDVLGFNIYSNLFNTDGSALADEDALIKKDPFNCIITSLVWKIVAPQITEYLETTAAEDQNQIYASFEVGFNEFDIIVIEGNSRNLQDVKEVITPEHKKFNEYKEKLKCYGGAGKIDDNLFIYRKIKGELIGLGMALVENPAAFVEPVKVLNNSNSEEIQESILENSVNIEQNKELTMANENKKITKINSIEEITAENLSICEATAVTDFINEQIKLASDKWTEEKTAKETAIKELQAKNVEIEAEATKNKTELENVIKELNELKSRISAAEAQDLFNQRMASFEDEYELNEEERTVIANDIKELSDENFEVYAKKMKVLMKSKKKCGAKCGEDKEMKASDNQEVATAEEKKEVATVVENAVENGTKEPVIPNAATPAPSFADRIANAFKVGDNVTLEDRKRRRVM